MLAQAAIAGAHFVCFRRDAEVAAASMENPCVIASLVSVALSQRLVGALRLPEAQPDRLRKLVALFFLALPIGALSLIPAARCGCLISLRCSEKGGLADLVGLPAQLESCRAVG